MTRHPTIRLAALVLAAGALLAGCASPSRMPTGSTPDAAVAKLGRPTAEYPLPHGGRRLQYSELPAGMNVWNMDYDAAGRLATVEQSLSPAAFDRIVIGEWRTADVLSLLGQPWRIEHVGNFDGPVWTYRFSVVNNPRRIHIHIGVVQRIVYTDEVFSVGFMPL